jgi:hypothetical protein
MNNDYEVRDVVSAPAQDADVVELGDVSTETKGGGGQNFMDGGAGYYF